MGLLIAAARRRAKQAVGRRLRGHGLAPQQFWLLVAIREAEGLSLRELAERLRVDQPTASRIVALLMRRKLVRMERDAADRRRARLALTPTGVALAQKVHPLAREVRGAIVRGLTAAETRTLRRLLLRVMANLDRFEKAGRTAMLLALLLGVGLLAACGGRAVGGHAAPPVPVVVAEAVRKDVPVQLKAIGTVEPTSTVAVKSQVTGAIAGVRFAEGADVRAGDVLFEIDPAPFEAALHQSEANLARDEAQARNADLQAERAEQLLGQGILAKDQYDQSRAAADALAAAVRSDRAAVENARLQLGYCTIRSPIDGRAGTVLVHAGNLVKAIDGGPLVVVNRVDPVYVSFAVPEKRLAEIRSAAAARRLRADALVPGQEDRPLRGELTFVDNAVDATTGTIRLKATFANPERRLWPGQFVSAVLTLSLRAGALVVPSQAVQTGQSGSYVYVVKPDRSAEARPVTVDGDDGTDAVVTQGLAAGEQVVTDGQLRLVPGARVEPRPALEASPGMGS